MKPFYVHRLLLLSCCFLSTYSTATAQPSPQEIFGEDTRIPFSQVDPAGRSKSSAKAASVSGRSLSTVATMSPTLVQGYSQTWQFTLTDPSGPANIRDLYVIFGPVLSSQGTCFLRIDTQGGKLQLANDEGTNWLSSPLSASDAVTTANNSCSVASQTLVVADTPVGAPNVRTVTVRLDFTRSFFSSLVYSYAQVVDGNGAASAWGGGQAVTIPSDTPRVGQFLPPGILRGSSAIPEGRFDVYAVDDFGVNDLARLEITYSDVAPPPATGNCKVIVDFVAKEFWLVPDNGSGVQTTKFAFNSGTTTLVQNGRCQLTSTAIQVLTPVNAPTAYRVVGRIPFLPFVNAPTHIRYDVFDVGGLRGTVSDTVAYNSTGNSPAVGVTGGGTLTLTGGTELISLDASDFNGAADLTRISLLINSSLNPLQACRVDFDVASRTFSLVADNGFGYMSGGVTINPIDANPSRRQFAANSQCEVFRENGSGSDFSFSSVNLPNTLRTVFALKFLPAFAGTRLIYAQATDTAGLNSPWVSLGSWSNSTATPPQISDITTAFDGTTTPTSARVTFKAGDLNGRADINTVDVAVDSAVSGSAPNCRVRIQGNTATLIGDNGSFAGQPAIPVVNGQGGLVNALSQNSSCQVTFLGTLGGIVLNSDGTTTYRLNFRLANGYTARNTVFVRAVDQGGLGANSWFTGPVLPPSTAAPPTISNPLLSSASTPGRERFTFSATTALALRNVELLIASSVAQAANGCQFYFDTLAGGIFLNAETGGGYQNGVLAGTNNQIANSRCTLFAGPSGRTSPGGSNYGFEFSTTVAFSGPYNIYARALDVENQSTGWVQVGTYTRQGTNVGTVYQASLITTHPSGGPNISNVYFLANQSLSNVGACFVWFDLRANTVLLANETGTAWAAGQQIAPNASLSNSLCDVVLGATPVVVGGSGVQVNFQATLKPTMVGTNRIYQYANGLFNWEQGWAQVDTRVVNPAVGSIGGSMSANTTTNYTGSFTVSHATSGSAVQTVYFIANRTLSNVDGCLIWFDMAGQRMYLANEAGTAWAQSLPFAQASPVTQIANNNCAVTLRQAPFSSGQTLTLPFDISFKVPMAGSQRIYGYAEGNGLNTNWVPLQGIVIPQ